MLHCRGRQLLDVYYIYSVFPIILPFVWLIFNTVDASLGRLSAHGPTYGKVQLYILGNVQDAGCPHIACSRPCCVENFKSPKKRNRVVCLGLHDRLEKKYWIFEATPDIASQMWHMQKALDHSAPLLPSGIFITHAHIGHYTGLMYLGKEGMNAAAMPVYGMPRFSNFLWQNEPWRQLVKNNHIRLIELQANIELNLNDRIRVKPILVPHRDELSETVGYIISGPYKKAVFIPDIDKWEKWDQDIVQLVRAVDFAFIDGTFFQESELPHRDISQVPHPTISETIKRFIDQPAEVKNKIYFIHLNHTNPALNPSSKESRWIASKGFHVARMGTVFDL